MVTNLDMAVPQSSEPAACEGAVVSEQGPCEYQEDAARVVCLPGRWMLAVADGCSGGPDEGAAAVAVVEAAETAWRAEEHAGGPEPDLAAMFAAADKAVLSIPCGDLAVNRAEMNSRLKRAFDADCEAAGQVEMLQTEIGRGSVFYPANRNMLLPEGFESPGFWGPATTLVLAVWDQQQGLRWGVCGDSWLFAVDQNGVAVALETPRLNLQSGGCLGVATPRPVYGRVPDVDGWVLLAATDGLYPALGDHEEAVVSVIETSWRDARGDVNTFLSLLARIAESNGLFDNTTGAAVKVPAKADS